jgi:hypothetical protein
MTKLRLPEDCKWASRAVQSNLGISPSSGLHFQWSRTLWKANEEILAHQKSGPPSIKLGRPAPHVRLIGLLRAHLSARFVRWPLTDLYDASQPLFQVDLIWGLWFTPIGLYKQGQTPPSGISIIIITFKRKARVWEREVSLEWMSSHLPI